MNGIKRFGWFCACMLLCMLYAAAFAEDAYPWTEAVNYWQTEGVKWTITTQVQTHMPLDTLRTDDLNRLLSHVTMELLWQPNGDEHQIGMRLIVDGAEAVGIQQLERENESILQISSVPQRVYHAKENALELLLDLSEEQAAPLQGFSLESIHAFHDGDAIIDWILKEGQAYFTTKREKQSVTGYGNTVKRMSASLTEEEANGFFGKLLISQPDSWVKRQLEALRWSGKHTIDLLLDNKENVLKATWTGTIVRDGGESWKFSLSWRRRRAGNDKDKLTIKLESGSSKDSDEWSIERVNGNAKGSDTITVNASNESVRGKIKQTMTAEAKLSGKSVKPEGRQWTGSIKVTNQATDEDKSVTVITPDLIWKDQQISGSIHLENKLDGHVREDWTWAIQSFPLNEPAWAVTQPNVSLEDVADDVRAVLLNEALTAMSRVFLRHCVLLPDQDTYYLSRDLGNWREIKDAAFAAVGLEDSE